ncbi:MAG: sulfite exporter TauE/SafE family protein [Hyphomonadaceae bacterium]|nr:sulfite exporter TauE/SafE family protein [Hyphomonadaceae bacterium]
MTSPVIAIILVATFVTATISGIFGMAGGLILMGVLAAFTPVATAMVLHGFIQIIANFSRAAFLRKHISWSLTRRYALGVGGALLLIAAIAWRPTQPVVFLMLGATAMLVWIPKKAVEINVERPWQAEICGFLVQTLNTISGVAGPLLDLFFVKTMLPRQTVVATKAATQVMAHAVKIAFWGFPLIGMLQSPEQLAAAHFPPLWVLALVVPLSLTGTWLGGLVLERMTDVSFREWTKWIVTVTGVVYLARGLFGYFG